MASAAGARKWSRFAHEVFTNVTPNHARIEVPSAIEDEQALSKAYTVNPKSYTSTSFAT